MTIDFAIAYIPHKMQELEVNNYFIKFRHFVIQPNDIKTVDAYGEYYLLVQAESDLKVRSEFGVYDLADTGINEQQYEHQSKITITNTSGVIKHIQFIQIIPRNL